MSKIEGLPTDLERDGLNAAFVCTPAVDPSSVKPVCGWFHFRVTQVKPLSTIRFKIAGLNMNQTLFEKGMTPVWQD